MTDMEIPAAAIDAGAAVLNDWFEVPMSGPDCVTEVLRAALPHLLTEVKSMCETAGEFGRAIGREEALEQAVVEIEAASAGMYYGDQHALHEAVEIIRNMASQPAGYGSAGLTASSRHPGVPEDTKPPQERSCDCYKLPRASDGVLRHHPTKCELIPEPKPECRYE